MKAVLEVLREFALLGLTSFGGPTAHVAFFRDRFVVARKWLGEAEFADLLALCQFLPGPASSQMGLSIGWKRAGWAGAFAAWFAFTLPSALILTAFGLAILTLGDTVDADAGWLRGLQIAVVAVIAKAVASMWGTLCPARTHQLVALGAAALMLATGVAWMQIAVIAGGAALGLIFFRSADETANVPAGEEDPTGSGRAPNRVGSGRSAGIACLAAFVGLLLGLPALAALFPQNPALAAFASMYQSGALVFGGGHVVLPLLSQEVVEPGWVTREEFLAGYGAAQAVPGPLFAFSAFLGTLVEGPGGPWTMAAVCLVGIFLPAWLLVLGVMPFWGIVVKRPGLRAALAGTNAAVVGLLGSALYDPVWVGAIESARDVVFLVAVAAALLVLRLPPWLVVILAGFGGWLALR
ncbi:MAG: chromate efflux transporter [Verrucomicrobiales bacterium]